MLTQTYAVSEDDKKSFASIYMLDLIINQRKKIPVLLEGQDRDLEPVLEAMLTKDLVDIQNNVYIATQKGRKALSDFTARYIDFLKNFDVFSAVDLEEGSFAFEKWLEIEDDDVWDEWLEEERWEDLRVAVADYKGINPVEIVFMSFLNEKRFGNQGEGWQFDLLLGSIWDDILVICNSALSIDDLGYEDEDGNLVSGEEVLRDVISQGAELNVELHEEEAKDTSSSWKPDGFGSGSFADRVRPEPNAWHSREYRDPKYVNPVWKKRWY